ncbi:MAG TPA: TetR/AcrR family transcriptional regulator [Burkholderiales bacterium]|nr:TetR/AcrR family transcriptional regulator [Burkholderiales bacterium]
MNPIEPVLAADTKERILDAAEALFIEQGFAAASLRTITARAGVNLAAVNYHFGSKDELIRAVFTRRLEPLNRERIALLDELERNAKGRALPVEQILEAFLISGVRVARDARRGGTLFVRLLGRAFAEPTEQVRQLLPEQFQEVVARYKAALALSLPALPERELVWRLHFIFGTIAYTMGGSDVLQLTSSHPLKDEGNDAETLIRHLVPFLAGGLTAPLAGAEGGRKSRRQNSN